MIELGRKQEIKLCIYQGTNKKKILQRNAERHLGMDFLPPLSKKPSFEQDKEHQGFFSLQ